MSYPSLQTRVLLRRPAYGTQIETVRGAVDILGNTPVYRGAKLIVQLVEDDLAGGGKRTIIGSSSADLDQKAPPYEFSFERAIDPARKHIPLVFEAWVEDWAGRKTHTMPQPVPLQTGMPSPRLKLEPISVTGHPLCPDPGTAKYQG